MKNSNSRYERSVNIIKKCITFVVIIGVGLGLAGCGASSAGVVSGTGAASDGKLQVVTTIFPEYDWVREIAGQGENSVDTSAADKVEITMLLDNGVDIHSFQPTAADIAKISMCDVFIYVGGESDAWVNDALKEAVNKDMTVINLMEILGDEVKEEEIVPGMQDSVEGHGVTDATPETEEHEEENDSEDSHHHDEGEIEYDEHVWLSLKNVMELTSYIADKLSEKDNANESSYRANVTAYNEKLLKLDADYQTAVDNAKTDTILFGDRFPFRYMTEDYGLNYYAAFLGCSAETDASFETVIFLAGKVDELGLPAIFTIEKSDQKIADTIRQNTEAKDQEILTMDSLQSVTKADVEAGETYYGKMTDNLEVLKKALGE